MSQTARRRRAREHQLNAGEEIERLTRTKDSLLDIVNILLTREKGQVAIPVVEMQAATRHNVVIRLVAPDPEKAGDTGHYIIKLEAFEPEPEPAAQSALERLKGRLWLPGQS
jgi:hypothetical protein